MWKIAIMFIISLMLLGYFITMKNLSLVFGSVGLIIVVVLWAIRALENN